MLTPELRTRVASYLWPAEIAILIRVCKDSKVTPKWLLPYWIRNMVLGWRCSPVVPRAVGRAAIIDACDWPQPPAHWHSGKSEWTMSFLTSEWSHIGDRLLGEGKLVRGGRSHQIYAYRSRAHRWCSRQLFASRAEAMRWLRDETTYNDLRDGMPFHAHGVFRMSRLLVLRLRRDAPLALSLVY